MAQQSGGERPGSGESGRFRPRYPVPPNGNHADGFSRALQDLLMHNRLGLARGATESIELRFEVRVEERENPGWVIEYIVSPA